MKNLLTNTYIPFGSQYYRAPSPARADWDSDLGRMAELGFNTVKFWVQWRWNNPAEADFDFGDIDELMDLSEKHGLRVMLNIIFDVAPAWIYKKYPDASMVTLDGVAIGPQTQPHRQIGGLGYCFNHEGVISHFDTFLRETVKRYTNHPALEIWNIGSEPELTSSMAEMREYADDHTKMGKMLCFCERCRGKFPKWLETKYSDITELNRIWDRNYRSFDQVELPRTRNTFNDMIDWRMFFVHVLGQNVQRRFEITKTEDQGRHPLMCHHVFIQGFPITSTANDPWSIARYGDLHGFTQMDDAMMIDVLRSSAKGKPVISVEMLMLPGYTLDLPERVGMDDIKRYIFTGIAGNLKGFIFWQFRPEMLGREAPTWGLSGMHGESTQMLEDYAEIGKVLQNHADLILSAAPQNPTAAILYHPENQVFAWASSGNEKTATDSLLGTHRALYEYNHNIDILHPKFLNAGELDLYDVLFIPFPYVLGDDLTEMLKQWIAKGGTLVGEAYFAGWDIDSGQHSTIVPGSGFQDVFKIKQVAVEPLGSDRKMQIYASEALDFISVDQAVSCSLIREHIEVGDAKILARFEDDSPAITRASYGKGAAIYIASYLGLCAHRERDANNKAMLASLAELSGVVRKIQSGNPGELRIDLIEAENKGELLIVQNLKSRKVTGQLQVRGEWSTVWKECFSAENLTFMNKEDDSGYASLSMDSREVKVFSAISKT